MERAKVLWAACGRKTGPGKEGVLMAPPKIVRCAVYTRKSTEHNLDLEFNSLDAQRESCEAYIKSQLHEGWRLLPDHYDDGGISGGSLDRPDLQRLLADIRARRVDNVVVYKVDRLTRSLTDFAKLVDLFDAHNVSFVSVTQAFNTTNSMGRLTLNVLLSFAQFEREVIGERVRDKVAASKRKGMWMGGGVPLGYMNQDKKLIIVPQEAETVRWIFRTYLEVGSIGHLLQKTEEEQVRSKRRDPEDGRGAGGCRFGPGSLGYLLRNRCYVGEISHKGQIYAGDHQPIVERKLYDAVQAHLEAGAVDRKLKHAGTPHLLKGKLFDSAGNRMTPSHSVKKGVRYRYYVSQAILGSRPGQAGRVGRVSAPDLEGLVEDFLRKRFAGAPGQGLGATAIVEAHLQRAVIQYDAIELALTDSQGAATKTVRLAWQRKPLVAEKGVTAELPSVPAERKVRDTFLAAIGKARRWMDELSDGVSIAAIAQREDKSTRHIRLLAPLAFVPPAMVRDLIEGTARVGTVTELAARVPLLWPETAGRRADRAPSVQ
jgi:site-specific DNA recombinase